MVRGTGRVHPSPQAGATDKETGCGAEGVIATNIAEMIDGATPYRDEQEVRDNASDEAHAIFPAADRNHPTAGLA